MRAVFIIGLAGVCMFAAQPVLSSTQTWDCKLSTRQVGSPFYEQLIFSHDVENKTVVVSDPLILYVKKEPVTGKVVSSDEKIDKFKWTVTGVPGSSNRRVTLSYSATLRKQSGRLNLKVTPLGADNLFFGEGTCRLVK